MLSKTSENVLSENDYLIFECGCKSSRGLSPSNNNYIYILLPNRPHLELTYVFIFIKTVCILAFCNYSRTNVIFGMRLQIKKGTYSALELQPKRGFHLPSFSTFEI